MSRQMKDRAVSAAVYAMLVLLLVFLLFPIYWMVITSFKTMGEIQKLPQTYWPQKPSADSYAQLFEQWNFRQTLFNTIVVATSAALGATLLGAMAGFAFERFDFPGKGPLFGFLVVTMAVPGIVIVAPIWLAYRAIGLLDTKLGIILVDLAGALTFAVYYLYAFFKTIPKELDDAARIDGCSWLQALFHVILPLSAPGVAVTFMVTFIGAWNEFLFAMVLTVSESSRVLTVRMFEIPGQFDWPYDVLGAAGVLVLLPVIIITLIAQRQIVEGLVAGSLKGA